MTLVTEYVRVERTLLVYELKFEFRIRELDKDTNKHLPSLQSPG